MKINSEIRHGSLLNPWKGEYFDFIVLMSLQLEEVSNISPWYVIIILL